MSAPVDAQACVVVPNWNGRESLGDCLDSLLKQTVGAEVVVVENGSNDGSLEFLRQSYPSVTVLPQPKNLGFAGGVNVGIRYAMEHKNYPFVALLNNDAVAEPDWLERLLEAMQDEAVGITTCTFASIDKKHIDSTGDLYTVWGLPYPRGRGEPLSDRYHEYTDVFGASGGASLYRTKMLAEIGLFDEGFFAYYEDVDLSFRAQLAGWKVRYVPKAVAYHQIGATSSKIRGFTTYQTLKNLPQLLWKNTPWPILRRIWPRLVVAWSFIALRALSRGHIWPFIKACVVGTWLWPKSLAARHRTLKNRKVSDEYIWNLIVHDLPPNAHNLRQLRSFWWRLTGKEQP